MLCLITKLHKRSTIYFSILFGVLFFLFLLDCIFIALSIAVHVFFLYCAIWFYDGINITFTTATVRSTHPRDLSGRVPPPSKAGGKNC